MARRRDGAKVSALTESAKDTEMDRSRPCPRVSNNQPVAAALPILARYRSVPSALSMRMNLLRVFARTIRRSIPQPGDLGIVEPKLTQDYRILPLAA